MRKQLSGQQSAGEDRPAPYTDDPSVHLEAVFERIQDERMQGIDLLNTALRVRAVGFQVWQGRWVGVLVTPWFLNLLMLPAEEGSDISLAPGERRQVTFPSGEYVFSGGYEPALGQYLFCSLMSPVHELPDAETAERLADEVMALLLQPTEDHERHEGQEEPVTGAPCGRERVDTSRRDLLFGRTGAKGGFPDIQVTR